MLKIEVREPVDGNDPATVMLEGAIPGTRNIFSEISYVEGNDDIERARSVASTLQAFAKSLERTAGYINRPEPDLGEVVETGGFDLDRDGDPPFKG